MTPRRILLSLLCMLSVAASVHAQDKPRLSAAERDTALQKIAALLQEQYVFPELRPQLLARLDAARRDGRYDVDDPKIFAERITDDLHEVSHDGHLWMAFDPAAYGASSSGEDGEEEFWRQHAIRSHHGLAEMKILGGNIRYLRITGFEWVEDETGKAYDAAMQFLKEGDAVIIDLRGNGGGSHSAVRYLISHFMPGGKLEMTFMEGSKVAEQSHTLEYLPAGRLQGRPLYVLIDGGVASAGEAFAYDVQQFKLGELVGERTAGAANNNNLLPVPPGFILSVSYGRPVHPVSNANWEGSGIEPTVAAPAAQALDIAQQHALTRLSQAPDTPPEKLADYAWAKVGVEARLHPVAIAEKRLKALAGQYGRIDVSFRDGALWLSRPNRPTSRLSPLTADGLFALERAEHLRAHLTGKKLELWQAGQPEPRVLPRS